MDYGGGGSGSGNPHHNQGGDGASSDTQGRNKKRHHRHTDHQIQRLESIFKDRPYPDKWTKLQLSRELDLTPEKIKFWFQNRRTQMKAQHERADNWTLREENDKIRCENIAISEALKNVICPPCGGSPVGEGPYFDAQKLKTENAQLKEELDRVSSIAAKYIGRPIPMSSLDLSMSTLGPSLHGSSSTPTIDPTSGGGMPSSLAVNISDMADVAVNAMNELIRLSQINEPLWVKSSVDGREVLNLEVYDKMFPRPSSSSARLKNHNTRIESSRDSALVIMNSLALVDMFMDVNKWVEVFPNIVSTARTLEVISSGMMGNQNGTLQLMYEELQVLSPFVPPRQLHFLRFCQQIDQTCWAVVDTSFEIPQENQFAASSTSCKTYRFPSGCLIQDMPNGYSRVTWVEHLEMEEKDGVHSLFRDVFNSGMAFGAKRWLTTLARMCERYACLMVSTTSTRDLIPSSEGKRSMMKLAHRLVTSFCASMNPSNGHQWTTLSGPNEYEVKAALHRSADPGQPNGVVLSAATTIWLPISPQLVFNFLRDEKTRPQWDFLSNQIPVQEVAHFANGSHPGNCISVLMAFNTSQNNMLILQESCVDSSGSMVVFGPVDFASISLAMNGEDPSSIYILPSGFAISPDGCSSGGSLVTLMVQISMGSLPSGIMTPESESTVHYLIGSTVHQIKAALNCTTTISSSS